MKLPVISLRHWFPLAFLLIALALLMTRGPFEAQDPFGIGDPDSRVLYRVNAGGPEIPAIDGGPDWAVDTERQPYPYYVGEGAFFANWSTLEIDASVAPTTPSTVFLYERWSQSEVQPLEWTFPIEEPDTIEVRLFFGNGWIGAAQPGLRQFNIEVEGELVEENFDVVAEVGHGIGMMKSYVRFIDDGELNIVLSHGIADNPMINAIEVLSVDSEGTLRIRPQTWDFGLVRLGDTRYRNLLLRNTGRTESITVEPTSGSGAFEYSTERVVLEPGANLNLAVAFTPQLPEPFEHTLRIEHSGLDSPLEISLTGTGTDLESDTIQFTESKLAGDVTETPRVMAFGPDRRLYVADETGLILAYSLARLGPNDYRVSAIEEIDLVQQIPNYNDDGSVNGAPVGQRRVTGLLVAGSANDPVLYVVSSDPRGAIGADTGLDTNSGTISQISRINGGWRKIDLVRGLPRSETFHGPGGLALDSENNRLFLVVGSNTNKGAPSITFGYTSEYALSAALLSVDLDMLAAMPVRFNPSTGQRFAYNLPTLDDPTRGELGRPDPDEPFGGNDGLNQAVIDPDGPVQVYAPGFRDAPDVILTESARLYIADNGPRSGWGGFPVDEGPDGICRNEPNALNAGGSSGGLHVVTEAGYYGGHPNPLRSNPANGQIFRYISDDNNRPVLSRSFRFTEEFTSVPFSMANPIECDYRVSVEEDGAIAALPVVTGMAQYNASYFDGLMNGNLLVTAADGTIIRIVLNTDGDAVSEMDEAFLRLDSRILDIATLGDEAAFPGTLWVATDEGIMVYEPLSLGECRGSDLVLDEDGDGYPNRDEILYGGNACDFFVRPLDSDLDLIADLIDLDDDGDNLGDVVDPFPIDPENGLTTSLPLQDEFMGNQDGLYGTVFTGVMTNSRVDYLAGTNTERVIRDDGLFGLDDVSPGDAYGSINTQTRAYQLGLNVDTTSEHFDISAQMIAPLFNDEDPQDFQSQGVFIGTGNQDNYLKLVLVANAGAGGLQVVLEIGGQVIEEEIYLPDALSDVLDAESLWLGFDVNPRESSARPFAAIDEGERVFLSEPVRFAESWLSPDDGRGLAFGLIATSFQANPFDAFWTQIEGAFTENHEPVAVGDRYLIPVDTRAIITNQRGVTVNDVDEDRDTLVVSLVEDTQFGRLRLDTDGSFLYTPQRGFVGEDRFVYEASDGYGGTARATVILDVGGQNEPPMAEDDAYEVRVGDTLVVAADAGLLANDSDFEEDPLIAVLDQSPEGGLFTFNPDGSFEYLPEEGVTGEITFAYRAQDLQGNISSPATVTIRVIDETIGETEDED